MISFKGTHFPKDIILYVVFFYVRYGVSYRDLEEIMAERGVKVDHATLKCELQPSEYLRHNLEKCSTEPLSSPFFACPPHTRAIKQNIMHYILFYSSSNDYLLSFYALQSKFNCLFYLC